MAENNLIIDRKFNTIYNEFRVENIESSKLYLPLKNLSVRLLKFNQVDSLFFPIEYTRIEKKIEGRIFKKHFIKITVSIPNAARLSFYVNEMNTKYEPLYGLETKQKTLEILNTLNTSSYEGNNLYNSGPQYSSLTILELPAEILTKLKEWQVENKEAWIKAIYNSRFVDEFGTFYIRNFRTESNKLNNNYNKNKDILFFKREEEIINNHIKSNLISINFTIDNIIANLEIKDAAKLISNILNIKFNYITELIDTAAISNIEYKTGDINNPLKDMVIKSLIITFQNNSIYVKSGSLLEHPSKSIQIDIFKDNQLSLRPADIYKNHIINYFGQETPDIKEFLCSKCNSKMQPGLRTCKKCGAKLLDVY